MATDETVNALNLREMAAHECLFCRYLSRRAMVHPPTYNFGCFQVSSMTKISCFGNGYACLATFVLALAGCQGNPLVSFHTNDPTLNRLLAGLLIERSLLNCDTQYRIMREGL